MRKWFLILALGALFIFPSMVFAQTNLALAGMSVQLWPEYDQPSMLVITDFSVADTREPAAALPRNRPWHLPEGCGGARVVAAACCTRGDGRRPADARRNPISQTPQLTTSCHGQQRCRSSAETVCSKVIAAAGG